MASTLEPEWDDTEREKALAYADWQASVGPCGHHHGETADEDKIYQAGEFTCPVCAELERDRRVMAERDEAWLKAKNYGDGNPPPAGMALPSDGRVRFMRRRFDLEQAQQTERG